MAKTTDLAEVETTSAGDVVVAPTGATSAQLRYAIANNLRLWVDEDAGTEEGFLLRTLDITGGEDAILSPSTLTKAEDLLNIPFKITDYQGMRNSDFEDSKFGVYAIVVVTDRDGQQFSTGLGSNDALLKVVMLHEAGAIPQKGWSMLETAKKPTKRGFYPVNLVKADDPTSF
jgi:hypothetical protein